MREPMFCLISIDVSDGASKGEVGASNCQSTGERADPSTLVIKDHPQAVANSEHRDDHYRDSQSPPMPVDP